MRKRKRTTATNADPIPALKSIYKRFATAYFVEEDFKKALKIRKEASPIFKQHPQILEKPPISIGRAFYIDFELFKSFPDEYAAGKYQTEN